jgi:peptide/nickel transport system substrate-binding protein
MYSHWANEEYDRLIAEGESALDEAAKNEAYSRVQQLIMDQVTAYYTVHEEKVVAARNSVKGYKITAEDPWLNLAGVTIEK